jgi:hypothetical protein
MYFKLITINDAKGFTNHSLGATVLLHVRRTWPWYDNEYRWLFPRGVKLTTPPSTAGVMNAWSYITISPPPTRLYDVLLS